MKFLIKNFKLKPRLFSPSEIRAPLLFSHDAHDFYVPALMSSAFD